MRQQNSQFILIATVIGAVLIIAAAVGFAVLKNGGAGGTPAQALSTEFPTPDLFSHCAPGDQCMVVDTSCSFCCKYTVINQTFESNFNEAFDAYCTQGVPAQSCACDGPEGYPACREGRCVMLK